MHTRIRSHTPRLASTQRNATRHTLRGTLHTHSPMYARDSAPLGGDASVISVVLDAIPVNSGGTHTVGVIVTTDASLEQALPAEILDCEDVTTATYQARFYDTPSQILFSHEVAKTGPQFVMIMVCPKSDVKQSAVRLLGTVAFRNPYGYLAASSFPFLPFYGVLLAVYIVTTFLYFSLALACVAFALHTFLRPLLLSRLLPSLRAASRHAHVCGLSRPFTRPLAPRHAHSPVQTPLPVASCFFPPHSFPPGTSATSRFFTTALLPSLPSGRSKSSACSSSTSSSTSPASPFAAPSALSPSYP